MCLLFILFVNFSLEISLIYLASAIDFFVDDSKIYLGKVTHLGSGSCAKIL